MMSLCSVCAYFASFAWWFALLSVGSFLVPFLLSAYVYKEQDLKKKYDAKWALVTGASSGIGRALTEKLAAQGINVVLVALDDKLLTDVHAKMGKDFPKLQFRKVGVNMGTEGYLAEIAKTCDDIDVNLVFNNAGFITTGLFADGPVGRQLANYECNATASLKISHHFLNKMLDSGRKGAVCFTSSPASLMPTPITVMYGATKAFLTEFATSLAAEVRGDGIDVLVVNPSPVDTGFYSGNKHDIDAMAMFQKTATSPTNIAACFFRSVGRTVVHEQGYYSLCLKMLLKVIDYNLLSDIICRTTNMAGDFKKTKRDRSKKE